MGTNPSKSTLHCFIEGTLLAEMAESGDVLIENSLPEMWLGREFSDLEVRRPCGNLQCTITST